jgi:hypothetical protein
MAVAAGCGCCWCCLLSLACLLASRHCVAYLKVVVVVTTRRRSAALLRSRKVFVACHEEIAVWSCAFSSDGSRLGSVGDYKQLVVYSVA